jgi:hypothetical protein
MKLAISTIFFGPLALVNLSAANFDVYQGKEVYFLDGSVFDIWAVFPAEPSCKDVLKYAPSFWPDDDDDDDDDVSGSHTGFRCGKNQDCVAKDPRGTQVLVMNFHAKTPVCHWSE